MALLIGLFCSPPVWPLTESEPNNHLEEAQELKIWETVEGYFQMEGDADWFRLVVDVPGRHLVRIDLSSIPEVDSFLSIFDASGKKLMTANSGGAGEPEAIINLCVSEGTYFIQLGSSYENLLIPYALRTALIGSWQEGMEIEPNDRHQTANDLTVGQTVRGYLHPSYDEDWYSFSVAGQGKMLLQIGVSALPGVDTRIDVYDGTGVQSLKSCNDAGAGEAEKIVNLVVSPGHYLAKVSSDTSAFNATFEYTLHLESPGPWEGNMELEPNNERSTANTLQLDRVMTGYAFPDGDMDLYALTVPEPGPDILAIELSAVPGVDTTLELFNEEGDLLHRQEVRPAGEGEKIIRGNVFTGRYFVALHSTGANEETPYDLKAGTLSAQPAGGAEIRKALTKALDYLAARQQPGGTWPGMEEDRTGMAGLGLMAFLGAECPDRDYASNIAGVIQYLNTQYHPSSEYEPGSEEAAGLGGLITDPGFIYAHDMATLSLIEAFATAGDRSLAPMIEDALGLIIRWQNTEHKPEALNGPVSPRSPVYAGWRYRPADRSSSVPVSLWQILVLRAAIVAGFDVPAWSLEKAADFIRTWYDKEDERPTFVTEEGQADTGILALQMCGYPGDPRIAAGLRHLQGRLPVWGSEDAGSGRRFHDWYTRALVMKNAGGDDWRVWKHWMCRLLVEHQNEDGSWAPARDAKDMDGIFATSMGALMLKLCAGHIPVYMHRLGRLTVVLEGDGGPVLVAGVPGTIEIILDASNSMWGRIEGRRKIEIAREALGFLIQELPEGMLVGLRVYGHQHYYRKGRCTDSQLVVPVGPLDGELLNQKIQEIKPRGMTPIAYSLQQAGEDLRGIQGEKVVILVSDGKENCEGDPSAAAKELVQTDPRVRCHVIGFGLRSEETRGLLKDISESSGGLYFEARNAEELRFALGEAVEKTARLVYAVHDLKGHEIFSDIAGGDPRQLMTGTYKLVLETEPPVAVENIVIDRDKETQVRIKRTDQGWDAEVH